VSLMRWLPGTWHHTEQYANYRIEAHHGQLKRRLRPMRGLKTDRGATVITGHASVQNIRHGHYETWGRRTHEGASGDCLHRAHRGDLIRPRERIQPATASHNATAPKWAPSMNAVRANRIALGHPWKKSRAFVRTHHCRLVTCLARARARARSRARSLSCSLCPSRSLPWGIFASIVP
jgi:hypothetical protein